MSENELKLNVTSDDGTILIQTQQLEVPKLIECKGITVEGSINTPYEWLTHKIYNLSQARIEFNKQRGSITLILNEDKPLLTTEIKGRIGLYPDFYNLHINEEYYYSPKELVRKVKSIKRFFVYGVDFSEILALEAKLKAKIDGNLEQEKSKKGFISQSSTLNVTLENAKDSFRLSMPIFKGENPVEFEVTVCYEPDGNNGVKFYLESLELLSIIDDMRDAIMQKHLESIETSFRNGEGKSLPMIELL